MKRLPPKAWKFLLEKAFRWCRRLLHYVVWRSFVFWPWYRIEIDGLVLFCFLFYKSSVMISSLTLLLMIYQPFFVFLFYCIECLFIFQGNFKVFSLLLVFINLTIMYLGVLLFVFSVIGVIEYLRWVILEFSSNLENFQTMFSQMLFLPVSFHPFCLLRCW